MEKVIKPLLRLRDDIIGERNYKNITEKLYQFLIDNQINVKINN